MIRFVLLLAGLTAPLGAAAQTPGQCKAKAAGFYQQYADLSAPRIPVANAGGIAVSLTGALGDPARGREVLIDKVKGDCLSCHKLATADEPGQGEVGPALDGAGARYNEAQLRQIIINPQVYFPDTIMPSYHNVQAGAQGSLLSAAEVEDLVAFLKTLK
jgi:sulfur-oxidizing protein SoxX